LTARIAFMFLSKLYRQMYAGTGISTDSARRKKSKRLGAVDGAAVQEAVPGAADAGAQSPNWEPTFLGRAFLHDDAQQESARFAILPEN
jgi:hypothetical protein